MATQLHTPLCATLGIDYPILFDGNIECAPLWPGESCTVVNDIKPAGDIVRDLVRDAS